MNWTIEQLFEAINQSRTVALPAAMVQQAIQQISQFACIACDLEMYTAEQLVAKGIEHSVAFAIVTYMRERARSNYQWLHSPPVATLFDKVSLLEPLITVSAPPETVCYLFNLLF